MQNIFHLLKLEWLKFKSNAVFRTILIIFTIGFPLIILLGKKILQDAPPPIPSSIVLYEVPTVWDFQGYVGNWFVSILFGFLVIYLFTSEVSYKTMRQNMISGLTRQQYFTAKMGTVVVLSLYATLLYYISCLVLGMIHTDYYDFELMLDNNWGGFRFFLMCLGYLTFALLIANLIRRGMLSIIVYLGYLMAVETIVRLIVLFKFKIRTANFAPMNAIEDIMPNPYLRIPEIFTIKEFDFKFLLSFSEAVTAGILYTSIFIYAGWWMFRKRDL